MQEFICIFNNLIHSNSYVVADSPNFAENNFFSHNFYFWGVFVCVTSRGLQESMKNSSFVVRWCCKIIMWKNRRKDLEKDKKREAGNKFSSYSSRSATAVVADKL